MVTLLIIHPPAALLVLLLTSSPLLADTVEVLELARDCREVRRVAPERERVSAAAGRR